MGAAWLELSEYPAARAFCANRTISDSNVARGNHHKVGQLINHYHDIWHTLFFLRLFLFGNVSATNFGHSL